MRQWLNGLLALCLAISLSACATIPVETEGEQTGHVHFPDPDVENPGVVILAEPAPAPEPIPEITAPPPPAPAEAPPEPMIEAPDQFAALSGWAEADPAPALEAFAKGCKAFLIADPEEALNPNLPQYGRYADWQPACSAAQTAKAQNARTFFETHFAPVTLTAATGEAGLLTGYYEPELDVRIKPDATYSEPILALPKDKATQNQPRSKLSARSARVIAYGKPIDVFFLQIQGSGRIKYKDGRVLRAAYAGHNSHRYRSIGRVLIDRGELTANQSAKRDIERWMAENGRAATRALMNENPRYIFFKEQSIRPNEGPAGAMRVPLTAMGSAAVDPRYHPYGTLAVFQTRLPQKARDYRGAPSTILVALQDTGSAIRGPLRGDLFFGSGAAAGAKAGVMKHPVRWTLLLPKAIAPVEVPTS
jgi:membrane-bound lytic murein transglycosylase A